MAVFAVLLLSANILLSEIINSLDSKNPLITKEFKVNLHTGQYWHQWNIRAILNQDKKIIEFQGVGRDITENRLAEEKLLHISQHDSLTQLYNRSYFEQEMLRFKNARYDCLGIIISDLDGLKLVNDTLGHDIGDKLLKETAQLIKSCFKKEVDVVARIGGDEFAIIMPNCYRFTVEKARRRIISAVNQYNSANPEIPINLSVGYSFARGPYIDTTELFKKADNNMYREKLHRGNSAKSAIVQTLMKTLEARDVITNGHSERMQKIAVRFAAAVGVPKYRFSDIRLLARFHDIGKVGIPDRLLLKPGKLAPEEMLEMQRHCEIGHRIALAASDLAPIADWILKHHEWWDGNGYPLGLKGTNIPLECRIIAIVDAFEAMLSNRPYKKAMSQEEAVEELKRCAGTQFDPFLVDKFLSMSHPIVNS